jgi:hypothetical protein
MNNRSDTTAVKKIIVQPELNFFAGLHKKKTEAHRYKA